MKRIFISASLLCILLVGIAGATSADINGTPPPPTLDSGHGLAAAVFSTKQGTVTVNLPDDMMAGDTITGTVVVDPAGATAAEQQRNTDELQGTVVDVGGQKVKASDHSFRWTVPAGTTAANLVLRSAAGHSVGQTSVPVAPQAGAPFSGAGRAADYMLPHIAQAGRPIQVFGPFDGDASNTSATLGGQPVAVLAESPRQFVGAVPNNASGVAQLTIVDRGVTASGPMRCVTVKLTTTNAALHGAQEATMTLTVGGLAKLTAPVSLTLTDQTPEVVTLSGGSPQTIAIAPADVQPDGTAHIQRTVRGQGPGSYVITAQLNEPAVAPAGQAPGHVVDVLSPENDGFVHGVARVKANAFAPWIVARQAAFFYRALSGGQEQPIDTQANGADQRITCGMATAAPADAMGWAVDWNTASLANGAYELISQLDTNAGVYRATTRVFVDQDPPIPEITSPAHGENVGNPVQIFADKGPGVKGGVDVKAQPQIITLPAYPINQHDHKYDGDDGNATCDPTAQASVLWSYTVIRDKIREAAQADKKCKGKTGKELDDCALDLLVKWLAEYKKTKKDGTDYGNSESGSREFLEWLGLPKWTYVNIGTGISAMPLKTLKDKLVSLGDRLKGVVIHAIEIGKKGSGHSMALKSIDDAKDKDGKHKVCMMDPETGKDICVKMDDDGKFKYPDENGKDWQMNGAAIFTGDPKDKVASVVATDNAEGWINVAKLGPSAGGWRATWNTKGFAPGFYMIRLTVTDRNGRTGSDMVEVRLR